MDRRLIPANARVAAAFLRGKVEAPRYVSGTEKMVAVPLADLLSAPHGRRERQLLLGERVAMYEERAGWAFVQAEKDGYVGYLRFDQLEERRPATHWVIARASHLYTEPDFKSHERMCLSMGSQFRVIGETARFYETPLGYIPKPHLAELSKLARDPVEVAERYLGVPYLWGGNSIWGIDCSGLVQAACYGCGIPCPGDSDMQQANAGRVLAEDVPLRRGDLLFWKGHVALVAGKNKLLHANAHHMAVACEDLDVALARIEAQGSGPVVARRRLPTVKKDTR
ncbi:NlpC/P60 family protein [Thalassobius vesicularis]|uniref:NlpC/P60 family protein n=1 Tax=Thalassobius vesicularis TaxID=1294297 RepID=A0A4S3M9D4_9RHOB|nr:C40 family peptidase [Thalassobius vesicularis]THD73894.1 NlpC/P60 family protein [Thalassobius vesicularis]